MLDKDDLLLNELYHKQILFPESASSLTDDILGILQNPKSVTILGQLGIRPSINIIKAIQKNGKANSNQDKEVEAIMKRYMAYMPENHTFHRKSAYGKSLFLGNLRNILSKLFTNTDDKLQGLYDALGKKISNTIESEREGKEMGYTGNDLKSHDFGKAEADYDKFISDMEQDDDRANERLFGDDEPDDEDWTISQMRQNYQTNRQGSDIHGMSIRDEFPYKDMGDEDREIVRRIRKLNAIHTSTQEHKVKSPADLENEDEYDMPHHTEDDEIE